MMNKVENRQKRGTRDMMRTKRFSDKIDIETPPVKTRQRRNKIDIIWAALRLKEEGKLDNMKRT